MVAAGCATVFLPMAAGPPACIPIGCCILLPKTAVSCLRLTAGQAWQSAPGDIACCATCCLPCCPLAAGDHPPTDEEGFQAFIHSLNTQCIAEMLEVPPQLFAMPCACTCCPTNLSQDCNCLATKHNPHSSLSSHASRTPGLCCMLQGAEAQSPISKYTGTRNQRHLFEKV
jgi:hypothetical protein